MLILTFFDNDYHIFKNSKHIKNAFKINNIYLFNVSQLFV